LSLSNDDIVKLLDGYEKDSKAYKEEALRLSWYMRGGLTYDDAMMLSTAEREIVSKIIKDNLEITKKSGMAFF
jgi:hypothetical protein